MACGRLEDSEVEWRMKESEMMLKKGNVASLPSGWYKRC